MVADTSGLVADRSFSMPTASQLSKHSNRELMDVIAESAKQMASLAATVVQHAGELDRREGWRDDGASSLEGWLVARLGVSTSTAKAYAHLSERLFDLPHLTAGLDNGDLSLDKVRAVADSATPESDRELARQARDLSVRELADVARAHESPDAGTGPGDQDRRSVRFNDLVRTVTAQLPPTAYAEVRACLEARAKRVPSDGETPFDQRLADAFVELIRKLGPSPGPRLHRLHDVGARPPRGVDRPHVHPLWRTGPRRAHLSAHHP